MQLRFRAPFRIFHLISSWAGGLIRLPVELVSSILSYLPNCDLKSLRLTCRFFFAHACLRLNRVFLSANPCDVEVFHAIADHETFRKAVVEIIWDDSRYPASQERAAQSALLRYNYIDLWDEAKGCPQLFGLECERSITDILARKGFVDEHNPGYTRAKAQQLALTMPINDSWLYYQGLQRQQVEVIQSGSDSDTLGYGFQRFLSLKRITITLVAHGWLFKPVCY
jgi:hypothetical protein